MSSRRRRRFRRGSDTGRGSRDSVIGKRQDRVRARWETMDRTARGAALVSLGSVTLVVMAMLVKAVGSHIPAIEILFFRSSVGFLFILPMFIRNPLEPFRTRRLGM